MSSNDFHDIDKQTSDNLQKLLPKEIIQLISDYIFLHHKLVSFFHFNNHLDQNQLELCAILDDKCFAVGLRKMKVFSLLDGKYVRSFGEFHHADSQTPFVYEEKLFVRDLEFIYEVDLAKEEFTNWHYFLAAHFKITRMVIIEQDNKEKQLLATQQWNNRVLLFNNWPELSFKEEIHNKLNRPTDIIADHTNKRIYIADRRSFQVQIWDYGFNLLSVIGHNCYSRNDKVINKELKLNGPDRLYLIYGLLFICETYDKNARIVVVEPTSQTLVSIIDGYYNPILLPTAGKKMYIQERLQYRCWGTDKDKPSLENDGNVYQHKLFI